MAVTIFAPLNSLGLLALMVEVMSVVFGHKLIMTNSVVATLSIRFHQRKDNLDVARRLGDSMTWRRCAVFVFNLRLQRKFNAVAEGKFQNCRILRLFLASYLKKGIQCEASGVHLIFTLLALMPAKKLESCLLFFLD